MKRAIVAGVLLGCAGCFTVGDDEAPDPCEGVSCPGDERCEAGTCVAEACVEKSWYPDADRDGIGGVTGLQSCKAPEPTGWVERTAECRAELPEFKRSGCVDCLDELPEYSTEQCGFGFDENCRAGLSACPWSGAELVFKGGPDDPSGFGTHAAVGDFDGDGYQDLVVSYEPAAMTLGLFWGPLSASPGQTSRPDLLVRVPDGRHALVRALRNLGPLGGGTGDALAIGVTGGGVVPGLGRYVRGLIVVAGRERQRFEQIPAAIADPATPLPGLVLVLGTYREIELFPAGDLDPAEDSSAGGLALVQHRGVAPDASPLGYRVWLLDELPSETTPIDLDAGPPLANILDFDEIDGAVTVLATEDLVGDAAVDVAIGWTAGYEDASARGSIRLVPGPFSRVTPTERRIAPLLTDPAVGEAEPGERLGSNLVARRRTDDGAERVELWVSATGASATSRGRIRVFDLDRGPTLIERGSLVGPAGGRGFGSWMDVDRAGHIVAGAPTFTSIEALVNSMGVAIPDDWSPVGEVTSTRRCRSRSSNSRSKAGPSEVRSKISTGTRSTT